MDREGMWFRLLAARYGLERGRLKVAGLEGLVWWRDIASIRDGGGSVLGGWFLDNLS